MTSPVTAASPHVQVGLQEPARSSSGAQVAMHKGLNAHARLSGSMASQRGNSAEEWALSLAESGRLQGRNGGVDPITSEHLDMAVLGVSDNALKKAAKQWVDLNSQPGGPMEGFTAEEKARAAQGAELFLRDRRQFAGPRLFAASPGPGLAAPDTGARVNGTAVEAWKSNAMRQLDRTFANAGLDPNGGPRERALYQAQKRQIDAATEVYVSAMLDIDELPADDGIRETYLKHLENNPGDLLGAYRSVQSPLARRQGGKIHDEVNSYPSWWPKMLQIGID